MQMTLKNTKLRQWMRNHYFWSAFILNSIIAICVFVPLCIKYEGVLTFAEDFAGETIPYRYLARDAIRSGDIFWNWNIDLGSDFLQSFGACWFIDPFRLIPTLLPEKYLLICSVYLMIARFAIAGGGTALFLKRYTKSFSTAMLGSILYAFSGYHASLLVFDMLGDLTVFFPFYMCALEDLVEDNKKGRFAFWVFILSSCSFVMFVGVFFFTVIYYFVKYYEKSKRFLIRTINCLLEGILGGFMAGISLIPNIYALLNDSRASSKLLGVNSLGFDSTRLLLIIRGWLFPAESLSKSSHIVSAEWCTIGVYLPLIGGLLLFAYLRRTNNGWLKKLLILLLVASVVPFMNNAFMMESASPYSRWVFMLILLVIIASCDVIDHYKEYSLVKEVSLIMLMIVAYVFIVYRVPWYSYDATIEIFRPTRLWIGILMAVIGLLYTLFVFQIKNRSSMKGMIFIGVILYAISTNIIMGHDYQLPSANTASDVGNDAISIQNEVIESGKIFEDLDIKVLPYRTRFWRDYFNLGMVYGIPNRTSFVSVVSSSINTLYANMGTPREFALSPGGEAGMDELLSVKYYVTEKKDDRWDLIASYNNGNRDLYLYEDPNALPIAYTFDTYMPERTFLKLPVSERTTAAISNLIVPDEYENDISQTLTLNEEKFIKKYEYSDFQARVSSHQNETSENFEKTNKTFSFTIKADRDKYAFVTVPYSEYWSATVNDSEQNIIQSNGMMAVPINKGVNTIVFKYKPIMTYYGLIITIVGFILFSVYLFIEKKRIKNVSGI